jgi:hypothetical protein
VSHQLLHGHWTWYFAHHFATTSHTGSLSTLPVRLFFVPRLLALLFHHWLATMDSALTTQGLVCHYFTNDIYHSLFNAGLLSAAVPAFKSLTALLVGSWIIHQFLSFFGNYTSLWHSFEAIEAMQTCQKVVHTAYWCHSRGCWAHCLGQ